MFSVNERWFIYCIVIIYLSLAVVDSDVLQKERDDNQMEARQRENTTDPTMAPNVKSYLRSHGIYTSVGEIVDFLKNTTYLKDQKQVKMILRRYEGTCMKRGAVNKLEEPSKRHPFIVIEGLYGAKRGKVSKRVAFLLHARHSRFPMRHMCGNNILPTTFDGRRAYYALSKYAGANIVPDIVAKTPLIGERYWLDQAMYSLAKTFTNLTLPPPNAIFYKYPADIVVPDLTFFINSDEPSNSDQIYDFYNPITTFSQRTVECYRRVYPPVIEVSSGLGTEKIARTIVARYEKIVEEQHFFNSSKIERFFQ